MVRKMELNGKQGLEQQQKLILNKEQRLSLEILRMQITELREAILEAANENPLLSIEEPQGEFGALGKIEEKKTPTEYNKDDFDSSTYEFSRKEKFSTSSASVGGEYDVLAAVGTEENFVDMLIEQICGMKLDEDFSFVCKYIIESLNDWGYLDCPPEEIAQELGISVFDVMQSLYVVQTLMPLGVGARNLSECLILQLVESKYFGANTIKIVQEGLELLAQNNIKAIAKLLETTIEEAQQTCEIIRSLNPIPSSGYKTNFSNGYIIPDASVSYANGKFTVTMNEYIAPKLSLHTEYCKILKHSNDKENEEYLKEKIPEARTLIKAVESRYDTLYNVITSIISVQKNYFLGQGELMPMTLEDIAAMCNVNASTVSRATQGKYIVCDMGTISLKSLFTRGIINSVGENVSVEGIKSKIQQFIKAEDPAKPLSDEDIANAMKAVNIKISRRTVAKYRDEIGIPNSTCRRNISK